MDIMVVSMKAEGFGDKAKAYEEEMKNLWPDIFAQPTNKVAA